LRLVMRTFGGACSVSADDTAAAKCEAVTDVWRSGKERCPSSQTARYHGLRLSTFVAELHLCRGQMIQAKCLEELRIQWRKPERPAYLLDTGEIVANVPVVEGFADKVGDGRQPSLGNSGADGIPKTGIARRQRHKGRPSQSLRNLRHGLCRIFECRRAIEVDLKQFG
jgi:hypothetical protein